MWDDFDLGWRSFVSCSNFWEEEFEFASLGLYEDDEKMKVKMEKTKMFGR